MKTSAVIQHIESWLTDYIRTSKVNGLVVGVSGGIDSAVTSTLCARTGYPVLCLEMPIHQNKAHVTRARNHIEWLKKHYDNVNSELVDLTPVFESFVSQVKQSASPGTVEMTQANTRARLRMTTLYYYAGLTGGIVAGTGNKVEDFGVGFYTKYGDGGVDISPIADLLKSEVYALGRALGVSDAILSAAPSDGLFGDARSDEDQIGASYDELEWAMAQAEAGKTPEEFDGRSRKVFEIYLDFHNRNKHKMLPIPVCEIPPELR